MIGNVKAGVQESVHKTMERIGKGHRNRKDEENTTRGNKKGNTINYKAIIIFVLNNVLSQKLLYRQKNKEIFIVLKYPFPFTPLALIFPLCIVG